MQKMMGYIHRTAKAPLVEAELEETLSDLAVGGGLLGFHVPHHHRIAGDSVDSPCTDPNGVKSVCGTTVL